MKTVWILAQKELRSFFDSLTAYLLLVVFLSLTGFFTWIFGIFGPDVFLSGQANLSAFFESVYWTLFFFIPALTMRLVAEERKTGTIEWILTKSVTERQIVLGKFLATLILVSIALLFTIPYYFTIMGIGKPDHGSIILGYVGILFMSSCYISLGLFASSITNNQIVAFILGIVFCFVFNLMFKILAVATGGVVSEFFNVLDLRGHYDSIIRGLVDSRDVLFFITLTISGLFLSEMALIKRNVVNA
jgi:ABC-2 type transport system permease protein